MSSYYQSGGVLRNPIRVVAIAFALVVGVLFLLPFTQHLAGMKKASMDVRSIDVALPPPPPPPPEPPPPEEKKAETPEPQLQQQPKPLSLSQLELSLNPGAGDAFGASFGMGAFEVETDAMGDLATFSISELDEVPRITRTPDWSWPRHAMGKIKSDLTARILIFINPDGRVEVQNVRNLNYSIVEREIIDWMQRFRFTPPKREGKAVRARYMFPVEIAKP
ncbi:MAG: hypothetical protein AAGB46_10500 [Verrucomicrobiota bacterium]